MTSQVFEFDAAPGLVKREVGLAAVTTTGYIGTQWDQGGAVFSDVAAIVNVAACKISAGNETYTFRITGSNAVNRSDAQVLDMMVIGHAGTITIETRDTLAGDQFVMRSRTERTATAFRFIDLHLTVAGTAPSVTFGAHFAKVK